MPPLALFACSLASPLCAQGRQLAPPEALANIIWPYEHIVCADLDGNGDPDVLGSSALAGRIVWHANVAPLSFGSYQSINDQAAGVSSIQLADLDGDGDDDVLYAAATAGEIGWHANLGAGSFATAQPIATGVGGASSAFAADLDGDGDLDVVAALAGTNTIAFYINDGSGNFGLPLAITTAAPGLLRVAAADLDGDGDRDVISTRSNRLTWHENFGFGFFGPENVVSNSSGVVDVPIQPADVDNDGDVDLMRRDTGGLKLYANDGTGSFAEQTLPGLVGEAFHLDDFDGDGDVDVLSCGAFSAGGPVTGIVFLHLNDGGGNWTQILRLAGPGGLAACTAADLDGDGDPDAVVTSNTQLLHVENVAPISSTATVYGQGCGSPAVQFSPTSTAIIGGNMTGTVTATPTPVCVVAMGLSNTDAPGIGPLPADLSSIGMTGCLLHQSAEIFGLGTSLGGQPFVVDWTFPVPGSLTLMGFHLYTQAFCFAPGVNPLAIVTSNGIDWLVGNQ